MRKLLLLLIAGCWAFSSPAANSDLKQSKFTQVVNDVQVISTADNAKHPAAVDALFKMPDVLRTGPASRAEMVAEDRTITRVGANTIFSFDPASRSFDLKQGSLLFNAPKGKGGGSIHTAAATAAVLGTTIIVVTTPDGGFKVLVLEGTAQVRFLNGVRRSVRAGQLMFVLPGSVPGPVLAFRLDEQVAGSQLVMGFDQPLPSLGLIYAQIAKQAQMIQSGQALDTGLFVGNQASLTTVQIINPIQTLNGGVDPGLNGITPGASGGPGGGPGTTVPTAPPGTVIPSGGGYLNPDGFLFTSYSTNGGPGPAYAMGPAVATLSDATISTPTLDPTRVFTLGVQVTFPSQNFNGFANAGFFARNINITTASIDFSPYFSLSPEVFPIFASENLTIANNLDLQFSSTKIPFVAGGQLFISSGVSITATTPLLEFASKTALNLDMVSIVNAGQDTALESFGPMSLNNTTVRSTFEGVTGVNSLISIGNEGAGNSTANLGDITLNNTTLFANQIDAFSSGTLSLTGSMAEAGQITGSAGIGLDGTTGLTVGVNLSSDPQTGAITLISSAGPLTVNNGAQLSAAAISMDSAGPLLIDTIAPPQASTMLIGAAIPPVLATIQNSDMSNLGALNVNAQTIVLFNVNLSGQVNLNCANGVLAASPNTGAATVLGDVNFKSAVTYQGSAAQNFINNGITIGKLP